MNTKNEKPAINICWLRRDLRLADNAALYRALKGDKPVLLVFIFDQNILNQLENKADARVDFIHQQLSKINEQLIKKGSSLLVKYNTPEKAWEDIISDFNIQSVYANHDYEPYAKKRDEHISALLKTNGIAFQTYKDQVIFEKDEVKKADGTPYTVFTPYYKQWQLKLNEFYLKSYPTEKYLKNLHQTKAFRFPSLSDIGFANSDVKFPSANFAEKLDGYEKDRDFPAKNATTHIGLHLRFGTVSIRKVASEAIAQKADKWVSELAWREFYMMILWHFPHTVDKSFKPDYDRIQWKNNEKEFELWCKGETGYPLVDAGMRELNDTGFMHNRVRMVVASFLCKHLLIDWRWGEAYFAAKLLDYEQASNVGGWQWACGSGNDAAPYFRVFNPELQLKKFDPKMEYVFKWAPEYRKALLPVPIVEHDFARKRALETYKKALNEKVPS
ncbi:cryptochrome/photolyase family protein [Pedobacter xixiisoli]|uniref:Deoxyribodipyrimidine photo-lyase n=1 Tax=Pedobacter xixiisoli TaxID=1476464 RepID=A0A286A7V2_9SPHI|nr:deoxyribodipyrimidine photo-lyase [Pedobacter xixiisoli]SOD17927.1 deoxyribodipyrimidine photo-lyase [Pedobacter xixiisoli]